MLGVLCRQKASGNRIKQNYNFAQMCLTFIVKRFTFHIITEFNRKLVIYTMDTHILYIEDEPINLQIIKRMLRGTVYHIIEAENAARGIAIAQIQKPDLILMDIQLPDLSGLDATRILKADTRTYHIPIIGFTADTFSRMDCLKAGCDAYLNKPISRGLLLRTIQQLLHASYHDIVLE